MAQSSKLKTESVKNLYVQDGKFRKWFDEMRNCYDEGISKHPFKCEDEATVSEDSNLLDLFSRWSAYYGKLYDGNKPSNRFQIFKQNALYIHKFNKSFHDVFFYGKRVLSSSSDLEILEARGYYTEVCNCQDCEKLDEGPLFTDLDSTLIEDGGLETRYLCDVKFREWFDALRHKGEYDLPFKYKEEELGNEECLEKLFDRWASSYGKRYCGDRERTMRLLFFKEWARKCYNFNKSSYNAFFCGKLILNNLSDLGPGEGAGLDDDGSDDDECISPPSSFKRKATDNLDIEDSSSVRASCKLKCGECKLWSNCSKENSFTDCHMGARDDTLMG